MHIRFYRLSSRLAPHLAFPRHPELTAQVDQCQAELAHTADLLRRDRVSPIHAEASVILDNADATLTDTSLAHLRGLAGLLDRLGARGGRGGCPHRRRLRRQGRGAGAVLPQLRAPAAGGAGADGAGE
ncbi:MAG: hypothetical protein IPM84_15010 [Anaerolineae bacterium]|nr:hypothetical protein [Anaerolineae bacterium]